MTGPSAGLDSACQASRARRQAERRAAVLAGSRHQGRGFGLKRTGQGRQVMSVKSVERLLSTVKGEGRDRRLRQCRQHRPGHSADQQL
mgnify:CR=1 FL=1